MREKQKEKGGQEPVDLEEEAEEDLVAENTHLGLMPQQRGEEMAREEELQREDDR